MRLVPASECPSSEKERIWAECFGSSYFVEESDIVRLGVDDPLYQNELSWAIQDDSGEWNGFLEVKESPAKLYQVSNPGALHLHSFAFTNLAAGRKLLERLVEQSGNRELMFGRDHGHFWPGVPETWAVGRNVLSKFGFESFGGSENDVEANLDALRLRRYREVREAVASDHDGLEEFFLREFAGRWRIDGMEKFEENPKQLVVLELDNKIEGFAIIQDFRNSPTPIGGGVWRRVLGDSWGALGPIGNSQHLRGQGYGGMLLEGALATLKERHVTNCVIDWTTLVGFYGKFGFGVTRKYLGYKRLGQ